MSATAVAVRTSDRLRQVVVTLSLIACYVGTLYGIGLLGTAVENSSGGVLSAQATYIAPATRAFSIWSVIYTGLLAYTVWQWLPGKASDPRARSIGYLGAASMLLNAAWLLVTQAGWIWLSVAVIVALAVVLVIIVWRLANTWRRDVAEGIIVDGTFGVYLGWVAVASLANVAAALVSSGVPAVSETSQLIAIGVAGLAGVIGLVLAIVLRGRFGVAAALAWGLSWVVVGRLLDQPPAPSVAWVALGSAVLTVLSALVVRLRLSR